MWRRTGHFEADNNNTELCAFSNFPLLPRGSTESLLCDPAEEDVWMRGGRCLFSSLAPFFIFLLELTSGGGGGEGKAQSVRKPFFLWTYPFFSSCAKTFSTTTFSSFLVVLFVLAGLQCPSCLLLQNCLLLPSSSILSFCVYNLGPLPPLSPFLSQP